MFEDKEDCRLVYLKVSSLPFHNFQIEAAKASDKQKQELEMILWPPSLSSGVPFGLGI